MKGCSAFKIVATGLVLVWVALTSFAANAQDGYEAWLPYKTIENNEVAAQFSQLFGNVAIEGQSPTMDAIRGEISLAFTSMLGYEPLLETFSADAKVIIGTPQSSSVISSLNLDTLLEPLGEEGFYMDFHTYNGKQIFAITANTDIGLLYGVFRFLNNMQLQRKADEFARSETPKIKNRILNHWDNLDRTVERGYAGLSLWDWGTLPEFHNPRYTDYARLNASLGINGTVLNNVNADARILTAQFLEKVAALASIFRPYGIKVFLSVNYQAPITIGGLSTADPLHADVIRWWEDKADEIYALIPDFGGFLVKADSEGEPGPFKYGRNHATGANVLARALAPHGGLLIWRAFVYSPEQTDRFREAYDEFVPLDGKFDDNVLLQVKNGPIDFQPREPFSPLFGALPRTNTMLELQITQEYFGFANHLAYMGTLFEEVLKTETFTREEGSTVGEIISGKVFEYQHTGIAGVVNLGTDRNWTGHPFVQSSWYAFGRQAWDFCLSAEDIANEWITLTFSLNPEAIKPIKEIMMVSREAGVNYRSPLGLTHLYAQGHHYGPAPWTADLPRPDWTAVYYHRADDYGLGFDRTETGSNAIEQYHAPLQQAFSQPETTPEELLLWFHHVSWDYLMQSGRTLWEELVHKYYKGVEAVRWMQSTWEELESHIDKELFEEVKARLAIQEKDAVRWRDSCVLYFQTFSGMEIPAAYEKPEHSLQYLMELEKNHYVPDPRYFPRMQHR